MNRSSVLLVAIAACAFAFLSCSGGGSPVAPKPGGGLSAVAPSLQTGEGGTHLWGYYDVTIDLDTGGITATPNRSVMWAANVVKFLNDNPMGMKFVMNDLEILADVAEVDIDVGITHPFAGMSQFDGYDVRGIFMGYGSDTLAYDSALDYPVYETDQFMMDDPVNGDGGGPDGYTRWFNATEFPVPGLFGYFEGVFTSPGYTPEATLCPYKYFADDLGSHDEAWEYLNDNAGDDGVFTAGSFNERNYYLEFPLPSPAVNFSYAVVASWFDATTHPANCPEAPVINVTVTDNVFYVDPGNNGGNLILDLDVWSWDEQPSDIIIESNVLGANYTFDAGDMIPTGGTVNYSTYHAEISADNVTGLEGNEFWVILEYDGHDYTCDFTPSGGAPNATLAAFFRYDLNVLEEPPCDDPILDHMNPSGANVAGALDDAEIIGDEIEAGTCLACYLTNGSIEVPGTNVTWVDAQTVTADFDFGAESAEAGYYDLYFTDGDCCEVVLEDAMYLSPWPVQVSDSVSFNGYHISKFIEDSDGVFHIISSYQVSSGGSWQLRWFHSEDEGLTWTDEGNIWPVSGTFGTCSTTGHVLAVDGNGGVYLATGGNAYRTYLCYLDTASLGDPAGWQPSDWISKQCTYYGGRTPAYWALEVAPDGRIFLYARHYSLSYINRWVYATSWSALPSSQSGNVFPSSLGGHYLQEQLTSAARGIVYNPATGHFFLGIGGRWDNYNCGAYLLEFTPPSSYAWRSYFSYTYSTVSGLGWYLDNYYGDVSIDSNNYIHWVYVITWPNPTYPPYTRQKNEYVMNYGTNQSGSWVTEQPINDSATYRFPNTGGYVDPRNYYRPNYQNLVVNSNDELILNWMKCANDPKIMCATRDASGGPFDDPPIVIFETGGAMQMYQGPQGEAYGDDGLVALTFTGKAPGAPDRGDGVYFIMTDGVTPIG